MQDLPLWRVIFALRWPLIYIFKYLRSDRSGSVCAWKFYLGMQQSRRIVSENAGWDSFFLLIIEGRFIWIDQAGGLSMKVIK